MIVVTGYNKSGWDQYGKKCYNSFIKYWPKDIELAVYSEEELPLLRGYFRYPPKECIEFISKYSNDNICCGKEQRKDHYWKEKDKKRKYNYRYDAVKFSKMAFYTFDAAKRLKSGILCWLDGDVLTFKEIPDYFLECLIDGYDCVFLGRKKLHSETGFVMFRLPEAIDLALEWGDMYATEKVFDLSEWHSAYVFDYLRSKIDNIRYNNLTSEIDKGHVWFQSPLRYYMDHLKGADRKERGYSKERKYASSW